MSCDELANKGGERRVKLLKKPAGAHASAAGGSAVPPGGAGPATPRAATPPPRPAAAPIDRGPDWQQLGELLVSRDVVTHTQLNEALLQQSASGKRVGRLLVELGALDEEDLAAAL